MRRGHAHRIAARPYENERDALELLAMTIVRGGYRVPVESACTKRGLQSTDVACALGYMRDRVPRDVTIAVVTRAQSAEIAQVSLKAYRRLSKAVVATYPEIICLARAADRWKVRVVIYDALTELARPESRRAYRELAKDTKMRAADYARIHKLITAEIQEMLSDTRSAFKQRLWGV